MVGFKPNQASLAKIKVTAIEAGRSVGALTEGREARLGNDELSGSRWNVWYEWTSPFQ